jgi:hypothetical protein
MSLRTLVPLCVVLGAATGCSGSDALVDYSVSGGFANGNSSLHVTSDGMATRTSRLDGTQTVQLDASNLADLKQKIADARFPSLEPAYPCQGCADEYLYEVTVQVDGHTYATQVEGLETAVYPESLKTLLLLLDRIAVPPP